MSCTKPSEKGRHLNALVFNFALQCVSGRFGKRRSDRNCLYNINYWSMAITTGLNYNYSQESRRMYQIRKEVD
jgi:hypothetical protein